VKQLEIPYIGIKIESIPTILKILQNVEDDSEFVKYYESIGKKEKTALEYLRSLRNLKLAKLDNSKNTVLTMQGKYLLEDNIELLYENLLTHCLKNFPDLKVIREIVKSKGSINLSELISSLKEKNFHIKRPQTLSSYLKLFFEGAKTKTVKANLFCKYPKEHIEYNQFLKLLKKFFNTNKNEKLSIHAFYTEINKKGKIDMDGFIDFLKIAERQQKIKLYPVNNRILNNKLKVIMIYNMPYYYFEVFENAL